MGKIKQTIDATYTFVRVHPFTLEPLDEPEHSIRLDHLLPRVTAGAYVSQLYDPETHEDFYGVMVTKVDLRRVRTWTP